MRSEKIGRRELLKTCGIGMLAVAVPAWAVQQPGSEVSTDIGGSKERVRPEAQAEPGVTVIRVDAMYPRGQWCFDPIGVHINKGEKVRWVCYPNGWGTTVTAFHPSNDNHELRIPENAKPFASPLFGRAVNFTFEWTFDVEGTYDYFSRYQELVGMVGRIVVGKPGGPAEKYEPGYGARDGRAVVFPDEMKMLAACSSQEIVAKKAIPFPKDLLYRQYPYSTAR